MNNDIFWKKLWIFVIINKKFYCRGYIEKVSWNFNHLRVIEKFIVDIIISSLCIINIYNKSKYKSIYSNIYK